MADDSPTQIDRNKAVALKYGMKVLGTFQNGEMLFAALPQLRPQVVLLDVTMRGMTGIETAAAIRKEGIQTKIILVTSMGQKMISDPQAAGADYLLVKPFPDEWFLTAVLEVLNNDEKDFDLQRASVVETPATDPALPVVTQPVIFVPVSGPTEPTTPTGTNQTIAFVYQQNFSSTTWTVVHNLGFFPNVHVEDSAGQTILGEVAYINENELILEFSAPFGGVAYLS